MPVSIDTSGLVIMRTKIGGDNLVQGLLDGGKDVVSVASELAPKDSGDLSESGKAEIVGNNSVEITFGNGLPDDRAPAQEFGTIFMPAQPYLFPALREVDILFHVKKALGL